MHLTFRFLQLHHRRQLFQQSKLDSAHPKISVVPLQGLDLVGVNAAVGVHMDRYLVEVVGTPLLEGHQLPDVREVTWSTQPFKAIFRIQAPMLEMPVSAMRSLLLCLLGASSPCPAPFPGAGVQSRAVVQQLIDYVLVQAMKTDCLLQRQPFTLLNFNRSFHVTPTITCCQITLLSGVYSKCISAQNSVHLCSIIPITP